LNASFVSPIRSPLFDQQLAAGAMATEVNGCSLIARYDETLSEYRFLTETVGLLDLSFRSRLCLTGADRVRFLHGQVTNDIKRLSVSEGCYAALTTVKGRMQSDLNILCLPDELLLDFEPGLTQMVAQRLEKYIVADDVQVVDVMPHYGLLSVQGPRAGAAIRATKLYQEVPGKCLQVLARNDTTFGEIYLVNHSRCGLAGFDLFVPNESLSAVWVQLLTAAQSMGGGACGWTAIETARIEAGIPRFGVDMDESNLAIECGIESRAISYHKGCYIGQEVLNRIHSIGHVNRELRGLWVQAGDPLPEQGDLLRYDGKEVGMVTSAVNSPRFDRPIALGYLRREAMIPGTKVHIQGKAGQLAVEVASLPFSRDA